MVKIPFLILFWNYFLYRIYHLAYFLFSFLIVPFLVFLLKTPVTRFIALFISSSLKPKSFPFSVIAFTTLDFNLSPDGRIILDKVLS